MYPRRLILPNNSFTHVFFRCHDRKKFLKNPQIKDELLNLWRTYKTAYKIKIIDFIIMDNHAHLLLKVEDTELLGDFMRVVNSQLARIINKAFKRDSQAIRERYKSPLITTSNYLVATMKYIWLNRIKVKRRSRPEHDPYCSVSYRLKGSDARGLLDDLSELPLGIEDCISFIKSQLKDALDNLGSSLKTFVAEVFESSHTIGDESSVEFRGTYLHSFLHRYDPSLRYTS